MKKHKKFSFRKARRNTSVVQGSLTLRAIRLEQCLMELGISGGES